MSMLAPLREFPVDCPEVPLTVCFAVRASLDPGVLPRLLEPFAKRGLVPTAVKMRLRGDGATQMIDIQVANLPRMVVDSITQGLRQQIAVERVLVTNLLPVMPGVRS